MRTLIMQILILAAAPCFGEQSESSKIETLIQGLRSITKNSSQETIDHIAAENNVLILPADKVEEEMLTIGLPIFVYAIHEEAAISWGEIASVEVPSNFPLNGLTWDEMLDRLPRFVAKQAAQRSGLLVLTTSGPLVDSIVGSVGMAFPRSVAAGGLASGMSAMVPVLGVPVASLATALTAAIAAGAVCYYSVKLNIWIHAKAIDLRRQESLLSPLRDM